MTDSSSLPNDRRVAYFSMEIALRPDLPTYAGGLGVLAGDMLRSAADLGVPIVGVTLVYRKGYFRQRLDSQGNQQEEPAIWKPEEALEPMTSVVSPGTRGPARPDPGLAIHSDRHFRRDRTGLFARHRSA